MQQHVVNLTDEQFSELNTTFPQGNGSGLIGARAEKIVKIYFRGLDPLCQFVLPLKGADLGVKLSESDQPLSIEVKGTASSDLAWMQLKVSSTHSWELITTGRVSVYRVCKVFMDSPIIHVLTHGKDFTLHPEPRWAFKRVPTGSTSI